LATQKNDSTDIDLPGNKLSERRKIRELSLVQSFAVYRTPTLT